MEKINSEHLKAENSVNIKFRGMSTDQIKMNLAKNEYVEITGEKQGIHYGDIDKKYTTKDLNDLLENFVMLENNRIEMGQTPLIESIEVDGRKIYDYTNNKNLYEQKMDEGTIALDTETTGFKEDDEVLQLSIVDAKGKVLFNQYFKPNVKKSWESAMAVNHITPESLKGKKHLLHYKKDIEKILKNAKRIVGYNLGFDMTMLEQNGIKLPTEKKYVDLMIPFAKAYGMKKLDGEYKWQKLITCAKFYGFKETEWHNSLADTNATMFCYKEMVKRAHITDREILQPRGVQNYKGRGRRGIRPSRTCSLSNSR